MSANGAVGGAPVKLVIERRAAAGGQAKFEAWIRSLLRSADESGSLEGASVLASGTGEYFILLRFRSAELLEAWRLTSAVAQLFADGDAFSISHEGPLVRSGLETWFTLPGQPISRPPPKWKMALVTWLALLPQAYLLGLVVPRHWPRLLGVALGTALPVMALTWIVMPNLVRRLHRWLNSGAIATVPFVLCRHAVAGSPALDGRARLPKAPKASEHDRS